MAPISSWPLPGFRCLPGVFRDAGQTAVHRASFSFRSEKVKVWGFGLPRGLIQWQESQREHTPPGRGALAGILVVIIVTNGSV